VPIGVIVVVLSLRLLPAAELAHGKRHLDVAGAVTITTALVLAIYAIVNGAEAGWASLQTVGLLGLALALGAVFLVIEMRVPAPLMPLSLFRLRNVAAANIIGVLWAAAMFAWFFLSALYLQQVLGYNPMQVGLAFLPTNLIMAACSIGISAKLIARFGIKPPLAAGLACAVAGLVLFARAPLDGSFTLDVLPPMLLLGFGAGIAFNPVLMAAMNDVAPEESGLASGVVNTSFMMGGALGLAILASIAGSHTDVLLGLGEPRVTALNEGYHRAFLAGALCAALAMLVGIAMIRPRAAAAPAASEAA